MEIQRLVCVIASDAEFHNVPLRNKPLRDSFFLTNQYFW
jgi:hypothetical protein